MKAISFHPNWLLLRMTVQLSKNCRKIRTRPNSNFSGRVSRKKYKKSQEWSHGCFSSINLINKHYFISINWQLCTAGELVVKKKKRHKASQRNSKSCKKRFFSLKILRSKGTSYLLRAKQPKAIEAYILEHKILIKSTLFYNNKKIQITVYPCQMPLSKKICLIN